jgi:hypothetical protein
MPYLFGHCQPSLDKDFLRNVTGRHFSANWYRKKTYEVLSGKNTTQASIFAQGK